ncbi:hypothetical protein BDDG_12964, partial [Blastomyces dermatitidis ATCC 18188]
SSYIDRSVFTDDSESDVKSLIKNLKNMIIKKLLMSCVTESSMSLSASSAASFSTAFSQSSILASVSDSLTFSTSVLMTSTSATSGFIISAFITSSLCFKKMLYRLNESYLSRITFSLNSIEIIIAPAPEIILIKDNNITETILFCFQASLITFSFSSVKKVVCTLNYKHSAL